MSGYTKGPWEYIDASESARHKFAPTCIIRGSGREVAKFSWRESSPYFPSEEESKSNAKLIAAAPELLEALQEMVAIVKKNTYPQPDKPSSTWGRMEAAEAVIAKALGNH